MLTRRAALAVTALVGGLAIGVAEAGADVDTGFGSGGRHVAESVDRLYPVTRPDGRVLAIGIEYAQSPPVVDGSYVKSVIRVDQLDARGNPDPSWGIDGTVRIDVRALPGFDELVEPSGVVLQPDGKLVVQSPSSVGNHLVRLTTTGALDPTFGGDGFVADQYQPCGLTVDLAYRPSDGSLISLARKPDPASECPGTTVRRYTAAGVRDTTFGNAAGYDDSAIERHVYGGSVAVDGAGRVLVAGVSELNQVAVYRLTAAGHTDTSFAGDGIFEFEPAAVDFEKYPEDGYPPEIMENKYAADLVVDGSNRAVLVGASRQVAGGGIDVWTARVTAAGALDGSFDGDGVAWTDLGGDDLGLAVARDAVGRIVVAGASRATPTAPRRQFTVRLLEDGSRDAAIGDNLTQYGTSKDTIARDLAVTSTGDAIVGGLYVDEFTGWKAGRGYIGAVDLDGSEPPTTSTTPDSSSSTSSTVPGSSTTSSTTTSSTTPSTTSSTTSTTTPTTDPPDESGPADFTPIAPVRVLDTREARHGAAPVRAGQDRVVSLAGANPPQGAIAAAVNVTVTDPTHAGFASAYPTGSAWPGTSTVNHEAGQTIANSVVVALGDEGQVSLKVGAGTAHLVLDVQGWYTAGGFVAVEPFRQFDSRATGSRVGTAATEIALRGVPAGTRAVALNLTVTSGDRPSYLTAWPSDGAESHTSVLNHGPGLTVANGVIVPVSPDGRISLRNAAGNVHLVVDVMGWVVGEDFRAVAPERVVDTRGAGGALGPDEARTFDVRPAEAVLAGADVASVVVNVTVTEPSATTFITAWPAGGARSMTSVLNAATGQTIANGLVLATDDGRLSVYNNQGHAHVVVDVLGWYPAA